MAAVYNFRSDGRDLASGRCLIPVDAFYQFTTAVAPEAERKDKWAFTHARDDWFAIAGYGARLRTWERRSRC